MHSGPIGMRRQFLIPPRELVPGSMKFQYTILSKCDNGINIAHEHGELSQNTIVNEPQISIFHQKGEEGASIISLYHANSFLMILLKSITSIQ